MIPVPTCARIHQAAETAGWDPSDPWPVILSDKRGKKMTKPTKRWRWQIASKKRDGYCGTLVAPTLEDLYRAAAKLLKVTIKEGKR